MLSQQSSQLETVSQNDQSSGQIFGLHPADESYLQETLTECRVKLESALPRQKVQRLPDLASFPMPHRLSGSAGSLTTPKLSGVEQ
jgi:hypothetical protein